MLASGDDPAQPLHGASVLLRIAVPEMEKLGSTYVAPGEGFGVDQCTQFVRGQARVGERRDRVRGCAPVRLLEDGCLKEGEVLGETLDEADGRSSAGIGADALGSGTLGHRERTFQELRTGLSSELRGSGGAAAAATM
jgi:hypothetical protein